MEFLSASEILRPKPLATLSSPAAVTLVSLLLIVALYGFNNRSKGSNSPPGPKPELFYGNGRQIPSRRSWVYYEELGKKFGSIVKLTLGGDELVILNDAKDAETLLGTRSTNYSSRKPLVFSGKYRSSNKRLLLLPYGKDLKMQRQAFHQMLQPRIVGSYEAMQEFEAARLIYKSLTQPGNIDLNSKRYAASVVFALSYGRHMAEDDRDLQALLDVVDGFLADSYPGKWLVDTFPILDLLPDFLSPWRAIARDGHEKDMQLYRRLLVDVKEREERNKGQLRDCFSSRLWEDKAKLGLDVETMAYIAGSAFEAGTDTTAGTMMWFLVAMVLYPHTLKKAQEEIDSLLGSDGATIPTFAHMDQLPYCSAITKELFRWMPTAPGAFPHYTSNDDEYKGYKINANTMVIPNIWAMHRNPDAYTDPHEFKPERFLSDEQINLMEGHYVFGFGRRACPGKYLATKTIWIGVARMIWAFNFTNVLDEQGNPIPLSPENCTSGLTTKPSPVPVVITPRSEKHAESVRKEWARLSPILASY